MRILHIADIHIRGNNRHDEIKVVINDLVEKAQKLDVDKIIIAGDIFHTKLQGLTGEYIDLLSWMLRTLATVAPIDLILGNHDFAQNNLHRQDSVSPVIAALNDPNVRLFKQSENIVEGDFNFGFFSLFDVEGYGNVKAIDDKINVAVFHGAVAGSKTEDGWELDGEVDLGFFKEWSFSLLGDIHKMQYLGYRKDLIGKQKPWIAYPGSLLQNTYAEDLDHGFLLWDIKDKNDWNVTWHALINPKPFVTLDWYEDPHALFNTAKKHPKNSRFRIRSQAALLQKDVRSITNLFNKKLNAAEVVFKSEFNVQTSSEVVEKLAAINLRSSDVLAKLISEHTHFELDSVELKGVREQLEKYIKSIPNVEGITRNVKWNVNHLKFSNLFCYGEDNYIDFSKMQGVMGILGANRLGKSSLLGALLYTLFNTTDRGPIKNADVCNIRHPYCHAEVSLSIGNENFLIERQTTKQETKKGSVFAPTHLNFFKLEGNTKIDLCGEQRNDTEKNIKNVLGTAEDFLLTTIASQGDINQFISHGSTKRKQILTRFLDLDFFEKIYDVAKQDVNSLKNQLDLCTVYDDWDQELAKLKAREENLLDWLESNTVFSAEIQKSLENKQAYLKVLRESCSITADDIEKQKTIIQNCEDRLAGFLKQRNSLDERLIKNAERIKKISQRLPNYDIEQLKSKQQELAALQLKLTAAETSLNREETKFIPLKKSLVLLNEVPCGDSFPTCKFIKDAHANKLLIEPLQQKINELSKAFDTAKNAFDVISSEEIQRSISEYENLKNLELQAAKEDALIHKEINVLEAKMKQQNITEEQQKLQDLLKSYTPDADESLKQAANEIRNLKATLANLEQDKMNYAREQGKVQIKIQSLADDRKLYQKLADRLHVCELIAKSFSKKGIPNKILKSQLPAINHEIQKILSTIVDFTIELDVDEATDNMDVYINYGDNRRFIELASGMEKTICSIAVRAALVKISTLPKSDMLVLDESFDALDANSIEACNRLLQVLKSYFHTVIVITHLDGIKDGIDQQIEIKQIGKDSSIVYK